MTNAARTFMAEFSFCLMGNCELWKLFDHVAGEPNRHRLP
jgi:hypothetical protein